MTVCVNEARPGGRIHYEWQHEDGQRFGITGEMLEIEAGARMEHGMEASYARVDPLFTSPGGQ